MEPRTNIFTVIVGRRGTGKTDFLKGLIQATLLKKVLIVDTFDSPVWRNMKQHDKPQLEASIINIMNLSDLKRWNSGVFRIFSKSVDRKKMFAEIEEYCTDTLVIFEDATKYIRRYLSEEVINIMIDCKQKGNDVIAVFHSLKKVPSEIVDNADYLTLFKTSDASVDKDKYHWKEIPHMMDHLRKSTNRFENITIQLQ